MDIKKTVATILTVPLIAGMFTGCNSGKKAKVKNESNETSASNTIHIEEANDPYLQEVYYVTSWNREIEYDPPVAGTEINVGLSIDPEHRNELSDITMYIFEDFSGDDIDLEKALLSTTGESNADSDYILFQEQLPQDMKTGFYRFVFVREDGTVDTYFTRRIVATEGESSGYLPVDKPVIYLYPQEETEVYVNLAFEGELACTYPLYNEDYGWHVLARPDGRITDLSGGRDYDYLFWEGMSSVPDSFDRAVCVRGCDTAEFLEEYLEAAGLNYSEINDFITFWLPKMENNEYNLISFPIEEYEEMAELNVSPAPDTMIRIYMVFTALDQEMQIAPEHQLAMPQTPERTGFTVVEWGGSEI